MSEDDEIQEMGEFIHQLSIANTKAECLKRKFRKVSSRVDQMSVALKSSESINLGGIRELLNSYPCRDEIKDLIERIEQNEGVLRRLQEEKQKLGLNF